MTSPDAVSIQPNGHGGQPLIIIRYACLSLSSETDFQNLLMHVLDVGLKQADPGTNPGGRMCLVMDMKGACMCSGWTHAVDMQHTTTYSTTTHTISMCCATYNNVPYLRAVQHMEAL